MSREVLNFSDVIGREEFAPEGSHVVMLAAGVYGDVNSSVELAKSLLAHGVSVEVHFTEDDLDEAIAQLQKAGAQVYQDLGMSVARFILEDQEYKAESAEDQIKTSSRLTTNINSAANRILKPYYEQPPENRPYLVVNSLNATFGYHSLNGWWPSEKLFVVDPMIAAPIWRGERAHGYIPREAGKELAKKYGEKRADEIIDAIQPFASALSNIELTGRIMSKMSHSVIRQMMERLQGKILVDSHLQDLQRHNIDTTYISPQALTSKKWGKEELAFRAAFLTAGAPDHEPYLSDGNRYILWSIMMSGFERDAQELEMEQLFREKVLRDNKLFAVSTFGSWGFLKDPAKAVEWLSQSVEALPINLLIVNTINIAPEVIQELRNALPANVFLTSGKIDYPDWMPLADLFILHGGKATVSTAYQLQPNAKVMILGGDVEQLHTVDAVWPSESLASRHNRKVLMEREEADPGSFALTIRTDLVNMLAHESASLAEKRNERVQRAYDQYALSQEAHDTNELAVGIMTAAIIRAMAEDMR